MTAIAPICRQCGHGHFKSEPCTFGTVIDARARFAAKAKPQDFVEVDFDPLVLEDQLRQCMATGQGFHVPPIRPDGIRSLGQLIADHDDDGRVIE